MAAATIWKIIRRCFKPMRYWRVRLFNSIGEVHVVRVDRPFFDLGEVIAIHEDGSPISEIAEFTAYVSAVDRDHAIERIMPRMINAKRTYEDRARRRENA